MRRCGLRAIASGPRLQAGEGGLSTVSWSGWLGGLLKVVEIAA